MKLLPIFLSKKSLTLRAIIASVQRVTDTSPGVEVVNSTLRARGQATLHARVTLGARGAAPSRTAHASPANARAVTAARRVQAILCEMLYFRPQILSKERMLSKIADAKQ